MSWFALVSVAIVCITAIAALVLVLGHMKDMRVTAGEIAEVRRWVESASAVRDEVLTVLRRDVENEKARLTQLANRTR